MKLAKALKEKKKLIKKFQELQGKIFQNNSVIEGRERVYDVTESMTEYNSLLNNIVDLKTRIQLSNAPIYGKIFRLAELKGKVNMLRSLNCESGVMPLGYNQTVATVKTTIISIKERDEMIVEVENEIEKIQDELDTFNATTDLITL